MFKCSEQLLFSCRCSKLTLTPSHSHSHTHSITLDMLNNFCFHVYAQKSLFLAKIALRFLDHSHCIITLSCEFRVHRAGSQLKTNIFLLIFFIPAFRTRCPGLRWAAREGQWTSRRNDRGTCEATFPGCT